jgi:Mn2+/Fe2+ NRAMP family transporter
MGTPPQSDATRNGGIRFKWLPGFRSRRVWAYFGPALGASLACIDPGNFASNVQAGTEFGYSLLWVLLCSNWMAILEQYLSAKLGIATGHTLPQNCRRFSELSSSTVGTRAGQVMLEGISRPQDEYVPAAVADHAAGDCSHRGRARSNPRTNWLAYLTVGIILTLNGLLLYPTFGGKF